MIIELSEKYNINSKYTSFITIYEREDKLLEVPKHQETILSNKFAKDVVMNKVWDMFGTSNVEDDYEDECYDMATPSFLRARSSLNSSGNLDIPCFLRRKKVVNSERKLAEVPKTNEEILEEKINEYYKVFVSQSEKSILTFLLYALYYLKNINNDYDYNEFFKFLKEHRQDLLESELCLKLLCLYYRNLDDSGFLDRKDILELMDDDYRKVVITNLKINIDLKVLTESEVTSIIKNNRIVENIDYVIWYLLDKKA